MKLQIILKGIAFVLLIGFFACNRQASTSMADSKTSSRSFEKADAPIEKKMESSGQADQPDDLKPNPIRNPFVTDPDTVIHLEKTACYGSCPVYTATILADGQVFYEGKQFVDKKGFYTSKMSKKDVRSIDQKLLSIEFFKMEDRYPEEEKDIILDLPWIYLFSEYQKRRKHIAINHGAPEELTQFIEEVDRKLDQLNWKPGGVKE